MAEYLSLSEAWERVLKRGVFALSATLTMGSFTYAEELADPTRPPAIVESAREQNLSAAATGPVLQSVLISASRKIATINGQVLKLGDKFGDARVTRITENEVVLRNGQEVQTLKLFPQVEKQAVSSQKHTKADSRQRSR